MRKPSATEAGLGVNDEEVLARFELPQVEAGGNPSQSRADDQDINGLCCGLSMARHRVLWMQGFNRHE
ncbi:hypothetical protein ASE17_19065 [Phenylobacterium sp. Root77]|uniref:hypothetical protein n=1 Tax=unclassified Phenylobacterium TaxID=2640670 RepID=UPI0006F87E8D|nr:MULTISPECIES: hypothetical protein [unclassified Phenylobacterium]KQW65552.1 hypothetical protein ASC73_20455 [Phenylobacterium sp. Root1277]KQW94237.1 hypothetical protein ASC79_00315 [Phenylobacterium sp. Root1290]KRC38961.1 hypothetical protein ASE17_19065 [Phenylobacterium sp. Root77]